MLLLLTALFLHSSGVLTEEVPIEEYPFAVALFNGELFPAVHMMCAGAIINRKTVLTAATCVNYVQEANHIRIKAGVDNLKELNKTQFHVGHETFMHPRFLESRGHWDWSFNVGLVVIKDTFEFGPTIQAITVSVTRPPPGTEVQEIGWGEIFPEYSTSTDHAFIYNPKLSLNTFPLKDDQFCTLLNGKRYKVQKLGKPMLCAMNNTPLSKRCVSSIGAPVVHCGILIGVLQWGDVCTVRNVSAYIVSMSGYNRWVYESVKKYLK